MATKDQPTILERILAQRKIDVELAKSQVSLTELKNHLNDFPLVDFYERSQRDSNNRVAVMAEVKRASPSKGLIAPNIIAAEQGMIYAKAGASVISCLTEPTWFKGTLDDMRSIRIAIDSLGSSRPALLRKDFLFDEYQIYEARANGADSLLLIVATFFGPNSDEKASKELLRYSFTPSFSHKSHLISVSRSLKMEPLVEVNTDYEMTIAIELGAKVIGINNRNLHTFSVDMNTTARLVNGVREGLTPDIRFAALSGINTRDDVVFFEGIGVNAVLVGEALMRAEDPATKINELKGIISPLVKICGILEPSMAIATAEAGADFIGLVFAANSKRKVSLEKAQEIVKAVNEWKIQKNVNKFDVESLRNVQNKDFSYYAKEITRLVKQSKPVIVGVFSDNPQDEVNELATKVPLDLIQLSGLEGLDAAKSMVLPTVKAIHVSNDMTGTDIANMITTKPNLVSILLDTKDAKVTGGTGKAFDWNIAKELAEKSIPFFLAGGLDPKNINEAVSLCRPFAVDVSSGVETEGKKDLEKIQLFIKNAKQ